MAIVSETKGFRAYTITIENETEHKSLVSLVDKRGGLCYRTTVYPRCSPYGGQSSYHTALRGMAEKHTELSSADVVLLSNLRYKIPTFK